MNETANSAQHAVSDNLIQWSGTYPTEPTDLDLRREAMHHAVATAGERGTTAVLEAATSFFAFLKGSSK